VIERREERFGNAEAVWRGGLREQIKQRARRDPGNLADVIDDRGNRRTELKQPAQRIVRRDEHEPTSSGAIGCESGHLADDLVANRSFVGQTGLEAVPELDRVGVDALARLEWIATVAA
jgi:hypothetical protein